MTTATPILDRTRADAFEARLLDVINGGATALMISIGHRTGLFDTMADAGPFTIDTLAEASGCNRRYVQEWLGAMTVSGVVDHDPETGTYTLPSEHAQFLTRTSPADNYAVFAQYIAVLGGVEDDVVDAFHNGGGVPYERFPRFHEVMAEDSGQSVLPALEDHILPLVPELPARLAEGIRVVDVGCGRGLALMQLAAANPASTFVGYDFSTEAIAWAREQAAERGLSNVRFEVQDAARLPEVLAPGSVDLITTFDAVHDQADPAAMLRGIRHALAPDGVYLAQDIDGTSTHHGDRDHVIGPLLYTVSCLHCMTVSLAQDGEGLGAMWGRDTALRYFTDAGFGTVEVHTLDHDPQNAYYVCRP
jgi:SAM-dependent methyltransferase